MVLLQHAAVNSFITARAGVHFDSRQSFHDVFRKPGAIALDHKDSPAPGLDRAVALPTAGCLPKGGRECWGWLLCELTLRPACELSVPKPQLFELLVGNTTLPNEMHFWKDAAMPSSRAVPDPLRAKVVRLLLQRRLACRAMARLPPKAKPEEKAGAPFCFLHGPELPVEVVREESAEELRFRDNPFWKARQPQLEHPFYRKFSEQPMHLPSS
jgi:hypothetical protein